MNSSRVDPDKSKKIMKKKKKKLSDHASLRTYDPSPMAGAHERPHIPLGYNALDMSERLKIAFIEQQPVRYIACCWLQPVHWQVQRLRCEVDSVYPMHQIGRHANREASPAVQLSSCASCLFLRLF